MTANCRHCGEGPMVYQRRPAPRGVLAHMARGLCSRCYRWLLRRGKLDELYPAARRQPPQPPPTPPRIALPVLPAANCASVDPELFFPYFLNEADKATKLADVRDICDHCPARLPCLQWALDNREQHGIWAGTTPDERKAMRRGAA